MSLIPWQDQNNDSVVDQVGADIQFRYTFAQMNILFDFAPNEKVIKPASGSMNISFNFAPNGVFKTFIKPKLLSVWNFNPQSTNKINNWPTIIFRYEGDRT